jgi:copper chaperone
MAPATSSTFRALVRVDMATFTIEIEESSGNARELSDAIRRAGYSPMAA